MLTLFLVLSQLLTIKVLCGFTVPEEIFFTVFFHLKLLDCELGSSLLSTPPRVRFLFRLGCLQLIKFIIKESPIGASFRPSRLCQHSYNQYFNVVLLQYLLFQLNSSLRQAVVYFCILGRISSQLQNLLKNMQMFHVLFILKILV